MTTERTQQNLQPESETVDESSTKKKDASHQTTFNDTKNHMNNSTVDKDRVKPTTVTENPLTQNTTKKVESNESTKKIHKYHSASKENNINGEETLILGIATSYVTPTHSMRNPNPSKISTASNSQIKNTKFSKIDENASSISKGEKLTEKIISGISKTTTKTFSTSTVNIETSSSIQIIESTPTKVGLQPTTNPMDLNTNHKPSVISLEPSSVFDIEYAESVSSISTPIDGLPTSYTKSSITTEKSIVYSATSTFTKGT